MCVATGPLLRVGLDVGPLHGHRTGIGRAVEGIVDGVARRSDVRMTRYLVSRRAVLSADETRLPLPGVVASHVWSRFDRPRADRWLRDVDIVHGTNYVAPPTAVPTVVSVYDCWFLRHPRSASPVVRRAGEQLRRAVGRGAWVHACSEATAEQVRSLLATDRIRTIPLGPPTPLTPPLAADQMDQATGKAQFVLAIGTEERRKDLGRLVAAFGLLAPRFPDLELVLAGAPGDDSTTVATAIADLPLDARSRVHRLGPVDDATKARLLSDALALAYPSLDEGFGFPILEAQHHGLPVVATDVGSVSEIGGEGVLLVRGTDPGDLADALAEVLESTVLRQRLVESGRRNLGRFSWETTVDQLVDLYREVAEPGTRGRT